VTGLFLEANGSPLHGAQPDVDVLMVESKSKRKPELQNERTPVVD
jgi:hypothetical protein